MPQNSDNEDRSGDFPLNIQYTDLPSISLFVPRAKNMTAPLLVLLAAAALTLVVGATIGLNWDGLVLFFKGKNLAVLGARGVGKTHLIKFLTSGSIPTEYKQTLLPGKASGRRFDLKELNIKVKDTLDISGDKAAYAVWKDLHDKADVVFYLLRADLLIKGDSSVEMRVREDLRHIGDWLQARTPRPRFFIVGTHCDLDSKFAGLSAARIGDYLDQFRKLPVVTELIAHGGGTQQVKVVLGSMKTTHDTEAMVYQIFRQVTT